MNPDTITISPGMRLRTVLLLAIVADTFQIVFSPLLFEGAPSPADDMRLHSHAANCSMGHYRAAINPISHG